MNRFFFLAILLFLASPAFSQDYLVVQKNGNSKLYKVNADASLTEMAGDVAIQRFGIDIGDGGGGNPDPGPDPDLPSGSIDKWVDDRADEVPLHKNYQETRSALAALYTGLSQEWDGGRYSSVSELMAQRKSAHNALTAALGTTENWAEFDADLIAELNRRQIPEEDLGKSLAGISNGLAAGKAINPRLITVILRIIINLQNPSELIPAILELLQLLRG